MSGWKHSIDQHHRLPQSKGGRSQTVGGRDNISLVQRQAHRAWHLLFRNYSPEVIAEIINQKWADPDYEFVVRKRDPLV